MIRRWKLWTLVIALTSGGMGLVFAQAPATPPPLVDGANGGTVSNWRAPGISAAASTGMAGSANLQPMSSAPRAAIAKVTGGTGTLPNDAGQVWREYDITPYTLRVTSTNRPEQAIVDWILRETGYDAWHSEPVGILCANGRTLKVYHTPQMQEQVSEIVDRFVNSQNQVEAQAFGIRLITLGSPDWRAKMQQVLRPVPVQSQGVQAWLLSKEDAAMMFAELQKRTDFREHSSPHVLVQNGQATVVAASRPQNYIKDVIMKPEIWPGFQPEMGQIEEGFSLEFKPLLSLDGKMIDAVVKCNIDQVEKMTSVTLDVPTQAAPRQRTKIQVPQMNTIRFAEKFHWPTDMVLIIGFGIVPVPTPQEPTGVKIPLVTPDSHADLLVVVENRGVEGKPPSITRNLPPASATVPR
ncbi:MAG TPA: hypothetical protein VFE46_00025 [Pirellulales bacterium]|jgi:hypothetical protein|nr:hypothetical protein [Pirellulales bacterium]